MGSTAGTSKAAGDNPFTAEPQDFSLVLGGPLFQLLRKTHLGGDALELLHRRVLASILITWVPLLVLWVVGIAIGQNERVDFLRDIEVHSRFLLALPILIGAELIVHRRMRPVVRRFREWKIVQPKDFPRFDEAIHSALKIRNSVYVEVALLLLVYTVGLWVWNSRSGLTVATWYALPGSRWRLTLAGYWYVFVSIPLFQFVLLRWYMRLFIWFRFLWQVNRMDLHLLPTHPDRCGGIGFLGRSSYAFSPILFAQGAILSGVLASRILYEGQPLLSFRFQIGGVILFLVVAILGPLLMFLPRLARVRREGLGEYGLLAQRYVDGFDQKWVHSQAPSDELLGTGDIQSLADLGNSYQVVREMRLVPFGLQDATRLAIATAAPLTPLLLTVFSFEELIIRIARLAF